MTDRASEIRARLAGATSGPWARDRFFWKIGSTRGMPDEFWVSVDAAGSVVACMPEEASASVPNAELIAHAPDDLAWLLAEREGLLERLGRVCEVIASGVATNDAASQGDGRRADMAFGYCAAMYHVTEALEGASDAPGSPETDAEGESAQGHADDYARAAGLRTARRINDAEERP